MVADENEIIGEEAEENFSQLSSFELLEERLSVDIKKDGGRSHSLRYSCGRLAVLTVEVEDETPVKEFQELEGIRRQDPARFKAAVESVPVHSIVGRAIVHEQDVELLLRTLLLQLESLPNHIVLALVDAYLGTEAIL